MALTSVSAMASDADGDAEMVTAIARYEAVTTAFEEAEDEMYDAYQRCRDLGEVAIPGALYQRATDADLRLGDGHMQTKDGRRWYAQGNAEWLRSRPRMREVYRDPTEEECRRSRYKIGIDRIVEHHHWPEAQARADEIVAAWDWLTAERNGRKEASGSFAAERAVAAAQAEREAACAALVKVRGRTPRGVQLKAALVASWFATIEDMDGDIAAQGCPTYALALSVLRDVAYGAQPSSEGEA
ncbi:hypothetical protein [Methylobacterium longum]|uniref:Uncharacterized protein n=1 Tax=Methylobacterium longum TaxID=767694 RepID=A0ABT8ARP3_9HYPH|nr:hypothetical protein [Methylobacterium longum]MDN3572101.1 hypothetical protein [Methylobacterium longum]